MSKQKVDSHTIHQKIEHFCRGRACMAVVLGFMGLAVIKLDAKTFEHLRDAYAQGFGLVGMYLREETARAPVSYGNGARVTSISGR